MRIISICILVCACGLWGMQKSRKLSNRINQINLAIDALRKLQGNMVSWKMELCHALKKVGDEKGMGKVFYKIGIRMEKDFDTSPQNIIDETINDSKQDIIELAQEDWQAISELMSSLGSMDSQRIQETFSASIERLKSNLEQAKEDKDKKARLYQSFGWMTGMAIALLVV